MGILLRDQTAFVLRLLGIKVWDRDCLSVKNSIIGGLRTLLSKHILHLKGISSLCEFLELAWLVLGTLGVSLGVFSVLRCLATSRHCLLFNGYLFLGIRLLLIRLARGETILT